MILIDSSISVRSGDSLMVLSVNVPSSKEKVGVVAFCKMFSLSCNIFVDCAF